MKSTGFWLRHLTMAGSCLAWAGCGGSDVPDPSSDALAATEPAAKAPSQPSPPPEATPEPAAPAPEVAATPAQAPTPATPAAPAPPPTTETGSGPIAVATANPDTPTPAPTADTPSAAAIPTPAADPSVAKGDTSGTDEMLRIAGSATPPPAAAESTPSPAAGATPAPAAAGSSPATGSDPAMAGKGLAPPGGQGGRPGGMRAGEEMALNQAGPNQPGGGPANEPGMGGSRFGSGGGAPGGGGDDPGPGAFRSPGTAVQAFLSALKAKNKDRLSQATARRAATEAAERNRKIFAAILEQSVSDEELDDMARSLEGFQVTSILPAKSTGQIGVLIGKMDNRDRLQRTVQVRREKEGWKVLDFGGVVDFKPVGTVRSPYGRRR